MNIQKIVDRIWIVLIIALFAAAVIYFIREGNPKGRPLKKEKLPEELYGSHNTVGTSITIFL